ITVTVTPQVIREMKPGERSFFTVSVTASPNVPRGRYALTFSISAREIGFRAAQPTNVETLQRYLRDNNFSARVLAAESLARMGDRNAIRYLVRTAMRGDRDARSRSIRALGSAGCKKQTGVLKSLLYERDGWIVGNAIMALGMLRAEKAVIQQCLHVRDRFVQTCALAALAMHGEKAPLPYLRRLLNDRDNFVRAAAAWGLAVVKDKAGIETLDKLLSINNVMLRVFIGDALVYLARSRR
ncbi:MAG TPA: HEAT repeat domain-containing protein, partial [Armatimonadetes bacterium]|nr:HEAT repeat domain-containing protein [Armatimonadota bacterium]